MTREVFFAREIIVALFTEVGQELEFQGLVGHLYLVGGGAIALSHSTCRATGDLDRIFEPKMKSYEVERIVGNRRGLPPD